MSPSWSFGEKEWAFLGAFWSAPIGVSGLTASLTLISLRKPRELATLSFLSPKAPCQYAVFSPRQCFHDCFIYDDRVLDVFSWRDSGKCICTTLIQNPKSNPQHIVFKVPKDFHLQMKTQVNDPGLDFRRLGYICANKNKGSWYVLSNCQHCSHCSRYM